MASTRLVVIGGDAAGMSGASQARRRRSADELEIIAFERGRATSYSACGIPYWIGGAVDSEQDLIARTPEQHRANGIDVRLGTEVTAIDVEARTVTTHEAATGSTATHDYDELLYATGSVPMRPTADGFDAPGVFGVQVLDDGVRLIEALERDGVRQVVVVGGGYIGLELAEACQLRGLEVTVVDRSTTPVGTFDPDIGRFIAEAVAGLGIRMLMGRAAVRVETGAHGRAVAVHTDDGSRLPADVVILGLGVRPAVELAAAAGIALGSSGGVAVDAQMRTNAPGVWAAGDCVQSVHRLSGQRVVVALGTHANKQGRVAGINIGGGYASFPGVIGTAVTKVCDLEVARTGLSSDEADQAGYRYVTASVDSTTRAGYFPGATAIRVKLIAEKRTGLLLGAQIAGRQNAAKRIDVFAVAIWNAMGVDELLGLDLSYAPPFSPVWDPVLIAARKAQEAVEKDMRADSRSGGL